VEFTITALDGASVKVESDNWMTAMGKALSFFEIDLRGVSRVTCSAARDGSILVEDGARSWMVRQHGADIQVRVTPRSAQESWAPPESVVSVAPEADLGADRPAVRMPESSLKREEPRTLAEHLFELTTEIDQLTPAAACERGLDAILAFVRAEGSCVVRGTLNDPTLEVVAARGPRADRFLGRKIGFGEGLVGMAFDMREALLVQDVSADTPHVDLVDAPSLSVLCVPLLDDEGGASGVVQLANPADRPFPESSAGVVQLVARALATALSGR
jgi:hypothetical protein